MHVAVNAAVAAVVRRDLEAKRVTKASADKAIIGWRLLARRSCWKQGDPGWTNVHHEGFEAAICHRYPRTLRYLEANRIILRTCSYSVGRFPKACKILNGFRSRGESVFWEFTDKRVIEKQDRATRSNIDDADEVGQLLRDWLSCFKIDSNAMDAESGFSDAWTLENVAAINDGRPFSIRDAFAGRFHSPFAQLKQAARRHIVSNGGEPSWALDISSCQPLLLAIVAINFPKSAEHRGRGRWGGGVFGAPLNPLPRNSIPNDLEKWVLLCEKGELYAYLLDRTRRLANSVIETPWGQKRHVAELTVQQFKREVLQLLMDCHRNAVKHPLWKVLAAEFPTITDILTKLKTKLVFGRTHHSNAAKALQQLEAEIMLNMVAMEHARHELPIITIHDEIITPNPDITEAVIRDTFSALNLQPHIKRKSPCTPTTTPTYSAAP